MFDVMFLAVLYVTVVGIGAEELVWINEASFQLFVNSLGGDRTSSHRFDNRWAAKAVLGCKYANEFIVKAGSYLHRVCEVDGTIYGFPSPNSERRFHRLRSPLSVAVGASSLMHAGFCVSNQRLS